MAINLVFAKRAGCHRNQAERNEEFARRIVQDVPDWSTTAAFYAALHFVDQYAEALGRRLSDHAARNEWLIQRREMRRIGRQYDKLRSYATVARYYCPRPSHEVRTSQVVQTRIFSLMGQVKHCVDQAMRKLQA